jgi:hypothetical protein
MPQVSAVIEFPFAQHGDCSSALGVDWPGAVEGDIAYVCPVNPEKRVTVLLAKDRGWLR